MAFFPVIINDGETQIPEDEDVCYIISKNGSFIKKKVGIIESVVKVDQISILQETEEYASIDIPKIPALQMAQVFTFFEKVYEEFSSEANILLYYHMQKEIFWLRVPRQEVSRAGVEYTKWGSCKGYDLIGTIHSHCDFGAFHSGIDDADEKFFDGLHITIGNNNQRWKTIAVSVVVNGQRFKGEPDEYIEGLTTEDYHETKIERPHRRSGWLENIYGAFGSMYGAGVPISPPAPIKRIVVKKGFNVDVPDGARTFPQTWMDFVSKWSHTKKKKEEEEKKEEKKEEKTEQPYLFPDYQPLNTENYFLFGDRDTDILRDDHTEDDGDEWSPCYTCQYRDCKMEMELEDLLDEEDETDFTELSTKKEEEHLRSELGDAFANAARNR